MTPYSPFKSEDAKDRYLAFYDDQAKKWPVDSETRTVETSYGQSFLRISGPATAQPLVLLPGLSANSLMWIPNIEALSKDYRTYSVDNINDNGRSIANRPITKPDDLINWLEELLNTLGLESSVNLMGISFGGWLASNYALRFPTRLNKIVLLTPTCTVLPVKLSFYFYSGFAPLPFRYFTKRMFHWLFEDGVKKDEETHEQVEEWIDNMFNGFRCYKLRAPFNPPVLKNHELQDIKVPTLFLVGENEKLYSVPKTIQRLNQEAPNISTKVIPDAGHDLAIVQAEMVNRLVLDFLKQS